MKWLQGTEHSVGAGRIGMVDDTGIDGSLGFAVASVIIRWDIDRSRLLLVSWPPVGDRFPLRTGTGPC